MKREPSSSPIPSSPDFDSPPKKIRISKPPASPHTPKSKEKDGDTSSPTKSPGGSWTPRKREDLIEKLLFAGMKSVKASEIAAEVSDFAHVLHVDTSSFAHRSPNPVLVMRTTSLELAPVGMLC